MGCNNLNFLPMMVLLPLLIIPAARAQQTTPFTGQGYPPPNGTVVYTSVILDRMLDVNDANYRFEVVLYILFTWEDPRARPAMLEATAAAAGVNASALQGLSDDPEALAQAAAAASPLPTNSSYTCRLPCSTLYAFVPGSPCCDGVWLPHLEFVNARGFSQDRLVRSGIRFPPTTAANPNAVAWWAHVQGEFYTPLLFKSFPFDRQQLVVQVEYADRTPSVPVNFVQSSTGLQLYTPSTGDDISSWKITSLDLEFFKHSNDDLAVRSTTVSNPADPWPLHPPNLAANGNGDGRFVGYLWQQGFNIIITVDRISVFFVISAILPIVLNGWLSMLVFAISPKHLDTRLGVVVTLFLSLTALMFVVGTNLPQSDTVVPTQQLVVITYLVLGFIGLESIIVYRMVTVQRQRELHRRARAGRKQFVQHWSTVKRELSEPAAKAAVDRARWADAVDRVRAEEACGQGQQPEQQQPGDQQSGGAPLSIDLPAGAAMPHHEAGSSAASAGALGVQQSSRDEEQYGAMGVFAHDTSDSEPFGGRSDGSSYASSSHRGAIAGAPAVRINDEEAAWWDARRCLGCLRRRKKRSRSQANVPSAGAVHEAAAANHPSWFRLQWRQFNEMRRHMNCSQDYALHIALNMDAAAFWFTVVGYNVGMIILLTVQSTSGYQAQLTRTSG